MVRQRNTDENERRRIRGLSDEMLATRRAKAKLKEAIERATRQIGEKLDKSVAIGSMTAQEAIDEFKAFTRQLNQIKRPSEPN